MLRVIKVFFVCLLVLVLSPCICTCMKCIDELSEDATF